MSLEKSKSIEANLQSMLSDPNDAAAAPPSTFCQKTRLILTNITVEPILILYILPSVMASLATTNLTLEKACRVNLALNANVCDALTLRNTSAYDQSDEVAVQKLVARMMAWKNVVQSLIPALLLLFLGSWSDRHQRRKPCIVAPIVGEICSCSGFLLCTYFFYELPMEFNAVFEALPPALTGGWFAVYMGIFSYISGVTDVKSRTLRIGAVNIFSNVGITVGIALSGILYRKIGFYGVFSLALSMYVVGFTYGAFWVKEPRTSAMEEKLAAEKSRRGVKQKGFLVDFFDLQHIRETFAVAFKDGARNRKKRICTIMVLVMIIVGPLHGEMAVYYLFVRYKFGWDELSYSFFSTIQFILHSSGTIFSLMFFSKFLKLDDTVLGMISCTSKVLACLVYALAPNTMYFYLGAVVELLNGTSFIAMRAIMSKLVPPEELGKLNSLFGVCEAFTPLIYGPLYTTVYSLTINVLPGAFFLLGGFMTMPAIFIFYWLYKEHQRDSLEDAKEKAQKVGLLDKIDQRGGGNEDTILENIS